MVEGSDSQKLSRSTRPRSPQPSISMSREQGRPPAKRARKAINCEPCRGSKLKCDRNRPCSSCVLRGTTVLCYQDSQDSYVHPHVRGDIDPVQEIAKLRNSINILETYIQAPSSTADREGLDKNNSSGMLANYGGGLYAGPTSVATHLMGDARDSDDRQIGPEKHVPGEITHEYDRDLVLLLPSGGIIDQLIDYYFNYCNWIYRYVDQPAFINAWARFKAGESPDRIVLATVCMIMAVAVRYLPSRHPLLNSLARVTIEELGLKYYDVMLTVLQRHSQEPRTYTLDYVELLLITCHFLSMSQTDSEEIWRLRGEAISVALAMGLHRDPGRWKISREVAERRRWTWWNVMLLERWQAFLFGRPLSIASHHFDTQFPSYCDPALDKTGRLYLPYIALFRLVYLLGEIMNDAVSFRPVPYDSILAHDRALSHWLESLPEEIVLDEHDVARSLTSALPDVLRPGVQSIVARTAFYHIRFTLHRPYTSASAKLFRRLQSVETAVAAANKLITIIEQTRSRFLANPALAIQGHANWGSFHLFSAALFLCFQLVGDPSQSGAKLFRENIQTAITMLEQSREAAVADKAFKILDALSPLYSADFQTESTEEREKKKERVLSLVRTLAFPYHDSPKYPRTAADSANIHGSSNSPADSMASISPPGFGSKQQLLPPVSSIRNTISNEHVSVFPPYTQPFPDPPNLHDQNMPPPSYSNMPSLSLYSPYSNIQQEQSTFANPGNEDMMWGASVGFGPGEWTSFLDAMQRPALLGRGPQ